MKRATTYLIAILCVVVVVCSTSCDKINQEHESNGTGKTASCNHNYLPATCTEPKTCSRCGDTTGYALLHSWTNATCTAPKTCDRCGTTTGSALSHSWADEFDFGEELSCGEYPKCTRCGAVSNTAVSHDWKNATCTAPETCYRCKATKGNALGHDYDMSNPTIMKKATCSEEGQAIYSCRRCSASNKKTLKATGHSLMNDACTVCGLNMFVGSKSLMLRTEEVLIDLSGRKNNQYDVVNLADYYDLDYLRSQGYTKIELHGELEIRKKWHILGTFFGTQKIILYPTVACPAGLLEDSLVGHTYVKLGEFEYKHWSYSYKTFSFKASIKLENLSEGRIYIRYDVGNTDIWQNRNVKVVVTPSK